MHSWMKRLPTAGSSESCEGIGTSGGSGQGVRLRGREAAGHLRPVNVREVG